MIFQRIKKREYNLNVDDLDMGVPVGVMDKASQFLTVSKGELIKILRRFTRDRIPDACFAL